MAHEQKPYSGLWLPQSLTDNVDQQKMFIDNINKEDENFNSLNGRIKQSVQSFTALRAINTTDSTLYPDGTMVLVKSKGIFYLDLSSALNDDGMYIIKPTYGNGRWLSSELFSTTHLTSDANIYVSTTGSDTTGDGTSAKPYKTIQYALSTIPKDLGGYAATINVASGLYLESTIVIDAFHGGTLFLSSDTKDTIVDTCKLNGLMIIRYCSAMVYINGFNFIDSNNNMINVSNCASTNISYCQSTVSSSKDGIYYGSSRGYVLECKVANRASALYANLSTVHSSSWNAGSINNTTALISINSATISKYGIQPSGTSAEWQSSGQIISQSGTQISDLITSGLSCTWGTIQGGYYKVGNIIGVSQVIVQLRVTITSPLSGGQYYVITGFPPIANNIDMSCNANNVSMTASCYINYAGTISYTPSVNISAGNSFALGTTYITNL